MVSNSSSSHVRDSVPILLPRTMVFRGSTVVMMVASIKGLGLCAVSSMSDCHCRGSPTNFCSCSSKSVCTRCSKLDGAEIWIRDFFFLANMMAAVAEHQTLKHRYSVYPAGHTIHLISCRKRSGGRRESTRRGSLQQPQSYFRGEIQLSSAEEAPLCLYLKTQRSGHE